MDICDLCGNKQERLNSLTLDGTDDYYNLNVCDGCYEHYTNDYFSPEQVDEIVTRPW